MGVALVIWLPLVPWTDHVDRSVCEIVNDLHPMDRRELFALRGNDRTGELARDLEGYATSDAYLEGGVAFEMRERADGALEVGRPVAFAMAWREAARFAGFAFFGRDRAGRAMRLVRADLARWRVDFGRKHNIATGGVKVLSGYKTARRWMGGMGAVEACDLGPIGRDGEQFTQMIWRF